ncbi:MAG: hypothetical protein K0R51_599 [Cytophagaceae bacterium]|nr:hypothetical protein [Cytophagaceae bacterium]
MGTRKELTEQHNLLNESIFRLKSTVLKGKRVFKNFLSPLKRFKDEGLLKDKPVIALSESELWNPSDNADNWILTAGKIENLRIAVRKLHGLEIKANEVFSFWKHMGNPNFGKGYVIGREIREGCIVPTVAGGLCQISNALYDAALKANFDILERHRHTRVIPGSLAEQDRDATVKWNYIDLRFRFSKSFRIEVELTTDKLLVVFRSDAAEDQGGKQSPGLRQSNTLNDCYSCGNLACFKHPDRSSIKQEQALTTYILDEKWPEYEEYIKNNADPDDYCIVPLNPTRLFKSDRYNWHTFPKNKIKATTLAGLYRILAARWAVKSKTNVFQLSLKLDKKIAKRAARLIPIESTHVVVAQNLLPFLFETGALGGRTFDVLMTRLPIEKLHERLDMAHAHYQDSKTLKDFRAPQQLIELENKALTRAKTIVTPHEEIAALFFNKVKKLQWSIPIEKVHEIKGSKILFPASAVGRKGAYEIRKLADELSLRLVIAGNAIEQNDFWKGLAVEKFNGNFSEIRLVIYPTYVEHQPRRLLKAIAKGIPLITTPACGINASTAVQLIETGSYSALRQAVINALASK